MSILLAVAVALTTMATLRASEDDETFFEAKIRPVLAQKCLKCHGGEKVSNGLRIDGREALLKGGKHGAAVVPGEPDKSQLIDAVRHGARKMPPGEKLDPQIVSDLVEWVRRGAPWPEHLAVAGDIEQARHWAFQPVRDVPPPDDSTGWSKQPVDRFILQKMQEHHVEPGPPADRLALLRRASFDLIGLPPTPQEVDAFLEDDRPDAFERVVERLLASPHYGERWGRHWMDLVRYADTAGDNADYPIPEIYRYRDYIIDAFSSDKPYDQFVREQLAGDLLAAEVVDDPRLYAERVAATGYLALARRYATAPFELWHLTLEDAIDTTGRAFMGLTLRCARCHDHKFDPVTTEDYYGLYGIFASTKFPWAGAEEFQSKGFFRQNFVPLVPPHRAAAPIATWEREIADRTAQLDRLAKEDPAALRIAELDQQVKAKKEQLAAAGDNQTALADELAVLEKERARVDGELQAKLAPLRVELRNLRRPGLPPDVPGAYAVSEGPVVETRVQRSGEPADLGDVVLRAAPAFLSRGSSPNSSGFSDIPAGASGRRQLAEWLTRPDHPLTARVMVNRVWQHHFGKGLVSTPSNFGLRGEPPSHPELLDWLTARFVEGGWSIKGLHRLILLSRAWQLAVSDNPAVAANDPANRWYARHDRRRLEAEAIRDAMLSVAGTLDLARPGTQPFPPIREWNWTQHQPFKAVYPSRNRSVYLMTQRIQRHPYLALFDGPDTNTSTDVRTSATVPLQALWLMNDPFVAEQAARLAERLLTATRDPRGRIELAYRLAYGRHAQVAEIDRAIVYVERYVQGLAEANSPGERREAEAWASFARVVLTANEFFYVD
ncbi:MAG TPA: DUF1553 domain-containing protein [Pirellulales bacterium]|nr:DUF1553 domain-containing protein [Pirellulales bacterium]